MQLSEEIRDDLSNALFDAEDYMREALKKAHSIQEALRKPEVDLEDLAYKLRFLLVYAEDALAEAENFQALYDEILDGAEE